MFFEGGGICGPSFDADCTESDGTEPSNKRITTLHTLARGEDGKPKSHPNSICKIISLATLI